MQHITITTDNDTQDLITEELLTVKEKDVANDGKLQIISKKLMKEELSRSPDLADMLSMRFYWIIKGHHDGSEEEVIIGEQKEETNASFMQGLIDECDQLNVKKSFEPDFDIY